jgi:hypothetical protein
VFVFVQDAAETVASPDVKVCDLVRVGDRLGQWLQRSRVRDAPMGPVLVVVPLVLAQHVQQVGPGSKPGCGRVVRGGRFGFTVP